MDLQGVSGKPFVAGGSEKKQAEKVVVRGPSKGSAAVATDLFEEYVAVPAKSVIPDDDSNISVSIRKSFSTYKRLKKEPSSDVLDWALTCAGKIVGESLKKSSLCLIIGKLSLPEHFDRVFTIAETISDKVYPYQPNIDQSVIARLSILQQFDRAFDIAETLPCLWEKSPVLEIIAKHLTAPEDFERILIIAKTIGDGGFYENAVYLSITKRLAELGYLGRALDVTATMTNNYQKAEACDSILQRISTPIHFTQILAIAKTFGESEWNVYVVIKVVETLSERKQCDRALDIAETIPECFGKKKVLKGIPKCFHMQEALVSIVKNISTPKQIIRARRIANEIEMEYWRQVALVCIQKKAEEL